jgi:hypothetical protein
MRVMARQTKITIETDSLLVLRGRNSLRAWCPQCGSTSDLKSPNTEGLLSREIYAIASFREMDLQ